MLSFFLSLLLSGALQFCLLDAHVLLNESSPKINKCVKIKVEAESLLSESYIYGSPKKSMHIKLKDFY